jgi:Staphylococcal nuclease homologue
MNDTTLLGARRPAIKSRHCRQIQGSLHFRPSLAQFPRFREGHVHTNAFAERGGWPVDPPDFRRRDRYGRLVAQVDVRRENGERWVQAEMAAAGHARITASGADRGCAAELMRRERAARAAKLGLWADPYYGLRRAEDPAAVSRERGRFTIVEGNVLSVRESGGTIYVNFGRRWSEDFTVTIAKRNERAFTAAGLEPKRLAGRRIRVRGWIEERGGPWVEASRPEQIEVMERN